MTTTAEVSALLSTSRLAAALANPARLRLLVALRGREVCVCHLVELLGLDQSTVSRHLASLAGAGLVSARREGRWAHYSRARAARGSAERRARDLVDALLADAPELADDASRIDSICCIPGARR